ncbi:MAG TPA: hypothetical protein VJ715_08625 [Pyrinomonadaceae bacterium]|nr:hypothetical protein [Pyrinomonadaceae bacterium]
MIARKVGRRIWRRRFFILAAVALLACAVLIAYARVSKKREGAFPLASDVPRGALLYAQFSDLPALVKRWDESKLKERYLASTNFQQFQSRHLALKLIERWEEFNSAVGFPLDALTISEATEKSAALAVYDVGRLEMVFVAPVGEEKLAAAKFFGSADQFEETELPDGTVYYSRAVEADRGRREQKFCFASARGRLVLATSEPLLLRTLANINGNRTRDRLSDDPSFKNLTAGAAPHFLTVWMDQAKLNGDWYFKQYWIMRNVGELKNIRACLLDLELQDGRWVERREFLLAGPAEVKSAAVPAEVARRILKFIPGDAPYFKLRALDEAQSAASLVRDTFTDRLPADKKRARGEGWRWQYYDDSDFYPGGGEGGDWDEGYYSLGPEFNSLIDDPEDAQVEDEDELAHGRLRRDMGREADESLRDSLAAARPLYVVTVQSPRVGDGPLFTEFRKGAVVTLQSPGSFRPHAFEEAVARLVESRLMIAGSSVSLNWANALCGTQACRELRMPALGWGMYYVFKGPDLILANSPEMMRAMLGDGNPSHAIELKSAVAVHDLTVIRLGQREEAFDSLMRKLDAPRVKAYWRERKKEQNNEEDGPSQEFFSGNIASLLDVASPVTEIRIKRSFQKNRLREEVEFVLREDSKTQATH